ncbi:MAG: hypothetical protein V8T36_01580 [Ruthenibacterium lactatiformans]
MGLYAPWLGPVRVSPISMARSCPVEQTVVNTLAMVSGIVCDGSQSLPRRQDILGRGGGSAGYQMASRGLRISQSGDGIVKNSLSTPWTVCAVWAARACGRSTCKFWIS